MKSDNTNNIAEGDKNYLTHPTKINLILFVSTWIISTGLIILAITDLFKESFFNQKYTLAYLLMFASTATTFKVVINYFSKK